MKILLFLSIFTLAMGNVSYSQTEYDYYEKLRLERKEKKVKEITELNDIEQSEKIVSFDKDGNHINIEYFYSGMGTSPLTLSTEIIVNKISSDGKLIGKEKNYDKNGKVQFLDNFEMTEFELDGYSDMELLYTVVEVNFDRDGRLEDLITIAVNDAIGNDIQTFQYDATGRISNSETVFADGDYEKIDYFYNDIGLLIREESIYNYSEGETTNTTIYEYKFYE